METVVIHVEGMGCDHCVRAIEGAVGALAGVQSVSVDLKGKTATCAFDPAKCSLEGIYAAIEEQGFEVGL